MFSSSFIDDTEVKVENEKSEEEKRQEKKRRLKQMFDAEYDEGSKYYNELKEELDQQAQAGFCLTGLSFLFFT